MLLDFSRDNDSQFEGLQQQLKDLRAGPTCTDFSGLLRLSFSLVQQEKEAGVNKVDKGSCSE